MKDNDSDINEEKKQVDDNNNDKDWIISLAILSNQKQNKWI